MATLKRIYKKVTLENGNIMTIYGSNKAIRIEHRGEEARPGFRYHGTYHELDCFLRVNSLINPPPYMEEFDGYTNDSAFSGVFVKFGNKDGDFTDECVRAFTYIA